MMQKSVVCKGLHVSTYNGGTALPTRRPATIYDVAEAAFVSIATVSRVLNGSIHVLPETRDRVEEAIKQLHFVPSTAARTLSGGRRWSIGLAYPLDDDRTTAALRRQDDTSVLYNDAIIRGASWQAAQLGYSLFACAVRTGEDADAQVIHRLYSVVDGIILTDRVAHQVGAMRIAKRMHAVHLSGSGSSQFGGTIRVDNAGGVSDLVHHLSEVHHVADFGFLGGSAESPDATARFEAFQDAVSSVGGNLRPENLLNGSFSLNKAEAELTKRLESSSPLPKAFVCANDQMAIGVLNALRNHGLDVPRDYVVTGFDDIALANQVEPALTTIAQPSFDLGVAAVAMVTGLLDREIEIGSVKTLPTSLVIRSSCGCEGPQLVRQKKVKA